MTPSFIGNELIKNKRQKEGIILKMNKESEKENEKDREVRGLRIDIEELKVENYLLRDILGQLLKIKLLPEDDFI